MIKVTFKSCINKLYEDEYLRIAQEMDSLVKVQPGFIKMESWRKSDGTGVTVSYWKTIKSVKDWKHNNRHKMAQKFGKEKFYLSYDLKVEEV